MRSLGCGVLVSSHFFDSCYGQKDRSVVWVSPIRNADVYVDYNNQGANYEKHSVKQLQSMKFTDNGDHDMSVCS